MDQFRAHDVRHGARLGQIQGLGRRGLFRDRGPAGRPDADRSPPPRSLEPAPAVVVAARRERVFAASNVEKKMVQRTSGGGPAAGELGEGGARPAEANPSRSKGGRPGLGAPWVALGISRAAYFRRRAAGELG